LETGKDVNKNISLSKLSYITAWFVIFLVFPAMSMEFKLITGENLFNTTFIIRTCNGNYSLNSAGKIFCKGNQVSTLSLDKDYRIAYLYYGVDSSMILIICAIKSIVADDNSGMIYCLDSMRNGLRWKCEIDYMEPCEPLLIKEKNQLYVSAFNFVGKISTENGHYFWKHTDLKSKSDFMGFYKPVINKDTVIFEEKSEFSAQKRDVKLLNNTGDIIESAP
jgi:hypothetical protein